MPHCQKKHGHAFVQHPIRNVCVKFKADRLSRSGTAVRQVFTT